MEPMEPKVIIEKYCNLYKEMIGVKNLSEAAQRLSDRKEESKKIESNTRREGMLSWVCKQDFCFFGLQEYDKKMSKVLDKVIKKDNMGDKIGVIEGHKKPDVAILYNKHWKAEGKVQSYGEKKQFAIAQTFKKGNVYVRVLSVHLQSGAGKRGERAEQVKQLKEEFKHNNLIICMDANDTSGSDLILGNVSGGVDEDISKGSIDDIGNCMPNQYCSSDHFVAKAYIRENLESLKNLKCEFIGNLKSSVSEVSTIKCRGPESEQLNKIGEWVKGTIDFILAKGSLSGVKVFSWNLLNKKDIFVKPGDSFDPDAVKAAQKYINEIHASFSKGEIKQLKDIDRHWEQEIIKAAHAALPQLAIAELNKRFAEMAELMKQDRQGQQRSTGILGRNKGGGRRRRRLRPRHQAGGTWRRSTKKNDINEGGSLRLNFPSLRL